MRQQAGAGPAAFDRQGGHRHLRHSLAAAARQRRADVADHLEAAGDVVEYLGDVLADLAHRATAGRADLARLVHDLSARQMFGQGSPARRFLPQRRIALRCRRGHGDDLWRGGGRLGLQLIKHQFQLLDDARDLLRRAAELLTPQTRDLDLQLLDLERLGLQPGLGGGQLSLAGGACRALGDQHPPQRVGIARKLFGIDRHQSK